MIQTVSFCVHLVSLLDNPEVVKYTKGDEFKSGKIPVDTAQCDNLLGLGNLTREVFGKDPNVCKCHVPGKYLFLLILTMSDMIFGFQA